MMLTLLLLTPLVSQQGESEWPLQIPTEDTREAELLDKTIWSPNLRPDARGFLATRSAPTLELGRVRLEIDHARFEYSGLLNGTSSVSEDRVFADGYFRAPSSAAVARTEVRAEYGLSENSTLRLLIPFESRRVTYRTAADTTERHTAQGLADVQVAGSVGLSFRDREQAEFTLGLRVPTGSTRETERSGTGFRLPYFQQLGGGTYAVEPGFRWTRWGKDWSFGAGAHASLPFDRNDQGWRLGEVLHGQAWASRRVDAYRSIVLGLEYEHKEPVEGADPLLAPTFDPSEDPEHTGGQLFALNAGVHMEVEAGHHVALEIGLPIWQDLNGPQIEQDFHFRVAWWMSF